MSSSSTAAEPQHLDRNRLALVALLGMVSGLPFLLTGSTLTTRMRVEGVEMATIGYFAWAHMPYTFKFLWAPLVDRFQLPWLGRRRGWMLACQLLLVVGIAVLGVIDPNSNIKAVFVVAVAVAIFSATLDIVIDAYRTEVLEDHERGPGGSYFVTGYRAAMVLAGAGVLILSDSMPWREAYLLMAAAMLLTIAATFVAKPAPRVEGQPQTFREAVAGPLADFKSRTSVKIVLV
ncbi:MAG: MFS transporter, partial [Kofleriaceae bacterium]|nr:MFS transporter [Kofleriaceae bacterium]